MVSEMQPAPMPMSVVLNELDEFAKQWEILRRTDGGWECRRARPRRQFRTSCEIWFFEDGGSTVRCQSALTRNLSEQGIGLVTKCVILQGVPIEIRILPPDCEPTHLAGVVVFCRYTRQSFHEVGISLRSCQGEPLFAEDPVKALSLNPWLQQALENLKLAGSIAKAQPVLTCLKPRLQALPPVGLSLPPGRLR
ncbi:MAG TPA: PilZ domain-containing protein [Phycisphaerae bacterium]|nr:PilZ domain-containing protein [Phycisphaerae bacterium]